MFQVAAIVVLVLVSLSSPGMALICLPIAWHLYDRLRAKHLENKRRLATFVRYQAEREQQRTWRAL